MNSRILSLMVVCCLAFCALTQGHISATSSDEQEYNLGDDYTEATFLSGYGDAKLLLKNGFDFINNGSSTINWDLAMTGAALSGQVYNGTGAEELLKELGYDKANTTKPLGSDTNMVYHPVSSMGYKHYVDGNGNEENIFAVTVRGTVDFFGQDGITDLYDGAYSMFDTSRGNVAGDLKEFIKSATGKSIDELKQEDNYFYLTGHSLGGAVANALSVDETVTSLCRNDKEHIYTYTFESPHTCVNLWWMNVEGMSNAYNFKDVDDFVTNVAPYAGATTYGKDMSFSVNDLDNNIFEKVFPDASGGSVTEAPKAGNYRDVFGHHDRGLDLVYIIQHGINDGWWQQLYQFDGINSMWPEEDVKKTSLNQIDAPSNWSDIYYRYVTENEKPLIWGDQPSSLNDDTPIALHDFDMDGVPELMLGHIGARLGLSVYTIYYGEVICAGGIGGRATYYSDDPNYHGIIREDSHSEQHFIYYNGLSNGKLAQTDIITDDYSSGSVNRTINDETLYEVYLDCTVPNGDTDQYREPKNSLKMYSWKDVKVNGWDIFLNYFGY